MNLALPWKKSTQTELSRKKMRREGQLCFLLVFSTEKCLSRELSNILPAGTPIVLFCLDNSIFLAANEVGKAEWFLSVSVLRKTTDICQNRALVVASDRALQYDINQLRIIIEEFRDCELLIV